MPPTMAALLGIRHTRQPTERATANTRHIPQVKDCLEWTIGLPVLQDSLRKGFRHPVEGHQVRKIGRVQIDVPQYLEELVSQINGNRSLRLALTWRRWGGIQHHVSRRCGRRHAGHRLFCKLFVNL